MKNNTKSGFVLPIIIGIVALGAAAGLWYSVDQEKSKMREISQIEQETAGLYIASQLGTSINKLSFVSGNASYVRFEYIETGTSIFARKRNSLWSVVEPKGGDYSCEQLKAQGFASSFLYDCTTRYEPKSVETLFSDSDKEAVLLGFLEKINDCAGCVKLTTETQDEIVFVLNEDFDDGDYVAVNIPDSEIVAINDIPLQEDENQITEIDDSELVSETLPSATSDSTTESEVVNVSVDDSATDSVNLNSDTAEVGTSGGGQIQEDAAGSNSETDQNSENKNFNGGNSQSESLGGGEAESSPEGIGGGGATIIEEIADVDDLSVSPTQGSQDNLDETSEQEERENDGENNETANDEDGDSSPEIVDNSTGGNNNTNNQEVINFFDLDSSDLDIQRIGDPSEDRQ